MTSSEIEARLRAALVADLTQVREGVDMSPDAITERIRDLVEMTRLCLELAPRRS